MKVSKYILFQVFGWGAFALFNIYADYKAQELTYRFFTAELVIAALGFVLSHFYKLYIQRNNWIIFDTEKLIKYVLLSTALLSIVYNIFYFLFLFSVKIQSFKNISWEGYLGSLIGVYILFGIWNLIYFTWIYIEKNKRIQIETLKMESSLKDLEIKTLRSNLQPHFIFNSLNSIRALIDENPELARDAITKISNILRNSITKQEATDTLENEMALVEDYLALEKIRFEERLHFVKNIDTNTLPVQIPTMMLQTLIENAIKHGISKLEAGGNIFLNTKIENGFLEIEIINDTTLTQMTSTENSLGFGLSSTKHRLKLLYENYAGLSLNYKNNQAILRIKIPLQKEK